MWGSMVDKKIFNKMPIGGLTEIRGKYVKFRSNRWSRSIYSSLSLKQVNDRFTPNDSLD
jgi:hypothetical protein